MIRVRQLTKLYGEQLAVDRLDLEVESGEILGLVGPNGAGKTTTLRSLAGILTPTSGTLEIAGHDIVDRPLDAKRRLALIPDEPALFESLTVFEHLSLTARIYGVADWKVRANRWLEHLELAPHQGKMADQLSRGMRQKVAVACALLHEPSVLLLDEPLTGLDPRGIRTLYSALRESAERGASVVVSSHLLGQIDSLCDRFLILAEGRPLAVGTKESIRAELAIHREDASLEEIFFEATEGRREPGAPEREATPDPESGA